MSRCTHLVGKSVAHEEFFLILLSTVWRTENKKLHISILHFVPPLFQMLVFIYGRDK